MSKIIEFENVSAQYESNTNILHSVNLSIEQGSFHFITGLSGSGKSSFLKLIYLDLIPSYGKLKVFSNNTSNIPQKNLYKYHSLISTVFQDFNPIPHLTVMENLSIPLKIRGVKDSRIKKDAYELLEWIELLEYANILPNKLSTGARQRLAIAQAVISRPNILLADEPTANVDSEMSSKILKLFEHLKSFGTTILFATHDIN